MKTITIWVLFQVYPFIQPVMPTETAVECMLLAQKLEDSTKTGDEILMKCKEGLKSLTQSAKIEVVEEFI